MTKYKIVNKNISTKICIIISKYDKSFKKTKHDVYNFNNFIVIFKKIDITYNTLCLSLYYFFRIKLILENMKQHDKYINKFLLCGRKMFIITLIISNKYLKDNCYKNLIWSKITKIKNSDINLYEKEILNLLNYNLYISCDHFNIWKKKINMLFM